MENIDSENLVTRYDLDKRIAYITYRGTLNSQITSQAYRWIATLSQAVRPVVRGYGCIFDFSQVTSFQLGNVQTVQQESREINQRYDYSTVPVALIADTAYQEGMIKVSMKLNPQQKRLRIVRSQDEALAFFREWHLENPDIPPQATHISDEDDLRTYYDPETKIAFGFYGAIISPAVTLKAYQWGVNMTLDIGIENLHGGVYDFRRVQEFKQENFQAVKRESREAHQTVDLSRVPMSLIVETMYQEQMVKVSSKISVGDASRILIVHSMQEALDHIKHWHAEQEKSGS